METNFSIAHQTYIELNKELAKENAFSGKAILDWRKWIVIEDIVNHYTPTSFTDYGCGPAYAYREGNAMDVLLKSTGAKAVLYDPCHGVHTTFPTEVQDGVICVDVIEHIPETDTDATLEHLFSICRKWMFLFISNKIGARPFPYPIDGELKSTHCTIKSHEEWVEIVKGYADRNPDVFVVLQTDHTDQYDGKGFTADYFNTNTELLQRINHSIKMFEESSPEMVEEYGAHSSTHVVHS